MTEELENGSISNEQEYNESGFVNNERIQLDSHDSIKDPVEDDEDHSIAATGDNSPQVQDDNDQGDDFGDFDDFDDFVEETEQSIEDSEQQVPLVTQVHPTIPCLQESDFEDLDCLKPKLDSLLSPILTIPDSPPSDPLNLSYFSERSASLWRQLAIESPEVHSSIDWKRSSIRRLLLVSMGVPLDLDEILPKKNTKRLVLPHTKPNNSSSLKTKEQEPNKKEIIELTDKTETLLLQWNQLASVSVEARQGMDEKEIEAHVESLKIALTEAEALVERWETEKKSALKDKETFESVIESLVEYAQKLRRK